MTRNAIGLIETQGLVAAVEALDACLKAACVEFTSHWYPTGGLVCIIVSGDVGAVKAAVDAGAAAAKKVGQLVGTHVIPRPARDTWDIAKPLQKFTSDKPEKEVDHVAEEKGDEEETNKEKDGLDIKVDSNDHSEEQGEVEEQDELEETKELSEDVLDTVTDNLREIFRGTKNAVLIEDNKRIDQHIVEDLRKIIRALPQTIVDRSHISNMRKRELITVIVEHVLKEGRDEKDDED